MGRIVNIFEFIKKAKIIHGDKYDYSNSTYINMKSKVKIICSEHGVFEQIPDKHIYSKQGCPKCSNKFKLTTEEFIKKAKIIHGDKYDYSNSTYINAKSKIKIICPEHGVFEQQANSHINQKSGCSKCSLKYSYNNDEFIEKAKEIHGDKYNYNKINYINNYTKIEIECPIHGVFNQIPTNHLSGKGCEICSIPKNEVVIKNLLDKNNIKYYHQYTFEDCKNVKLLPFDFYLPELNICIEYNGKQHYEPIEFFGGDEGFNKQQKRDKLKVKFCNENNIKLLIIAYNENTIDKFYSFFIL